ncbi:MAG: hypothetical protein E7179_03445 [Erysipelotrichaceae bacterium]|jgi:hypothetical protein|nr:hypothetical protein [Erysipelotrichaceae bacterium]
MSWFNYVGLILVGAIMVPNIAYSIKHKFPENKDIPPAITVFESIGRYGSMVFMVFNVPYTWFSFFFPSGLTVYIVVNVMLVVAYIVLFILFWDKGGLAKALFLSILPSLIFLFSGVMIVSVPLIVLSIVFSLSHIFISVKTI